MPTIQIYLTEEDMGKLVYHTLERNKERKRVGEKKTLTMRKIAQDWVHEHLANMRALEG